MPPTTLRTSAKVGRIRDKDPDIDALFRLAAKLGLSERETMRRALHLLETMHARFPETGHPDVRK